MLELEKGFRLLTEYHSFLFIEENKEYEEEYY